MGQFGNRDATEQTDNLSRSTRFTKREYRRGIERESLKFPGTFSISLEDGTPSYRVRVSDHKLERIGVVSLPRGMAFGQFGQWTGLAPDDSPLLLHDTSFQEIYALDLQLPRTKFRRDSACSLTVDLVVVGSGLADGWSANPKLSEPSTLR